MNKQNNAPLFHIVKRGALPWYQAWGIRAAAIVLALLFCALVTMPDRRAKTPCQVYVDHDIRRRWHAAKDMDTRSEHRACCCASLWQ